MRPDEPEIDVQAYVQDLEKHLQLSLFGGQVADPEGAVLLVRGALAGGDSGRAAALADATRRLAAATPDHPNMAAAADHARGLIHQDGALLEQVVGRYTTARARATALEDAGRAQAGQGSQDSAVALLTRPTRCMRSSARPRARPGSGPGCARWAPGCATGPIEDRPAFGWDSLTDTERTITDLVAEGLSNRQVASRVFLSTHTVAFHLRHVFWKLGVTSRVQLARMAAEQTA